MSWCDGFRSVSRADTPLAEYTWYRLGGPARWLIQPRDPAELGAVVAACQAAGVRWRVLGRGANVLVRDEGFDGAVLRLCGAAFEHVQVDPPFVIAGAGADFPKLIRASIDAGLCGLEALAGIPGTLGGVIRMNAGGRHGEIATWVETVDVLDGAGRVRRIPAGDMGFSYRGTTLQGGIVLGARLRLAPGERESALRRYRAIWNEKAASQPAVGERSAGCIFKNPPGQAAGRLLDEAGLKGARIGDAEISARHANFIVAGPQAKAQHVLDLIALARDRVWNRSGVRLELEVELW
jgi:UDP-N-acetylmuramate dehydrogenase